MSFIQNQREKSVSEKIIKEGEIGELVGKSRTSSCSFRKDILSKDNKSTKRNNMFPGYIFMQTSSLGELKYYLKGNISTSGF
jgi:transcription antitermination factor NusG